MDNPRLDSDVVVALDCFIEGVLGPNNPTIDVVINGNSC